MTDRPAAYGYLANVWNALHSVWEGMSVTLSQMNRKPITTQYPDRIEKPVEETLPERYRGLLEVDAAICSGCGACSRDCPIGCITTDVRADPEAGRLIHGFYVDLGKCMFCGLCTEACPTHAIRHTRLFVASNVDVLNLVVDFVDEPRPVHRVRKGEPPAESAPVGSILAARLARIRWDRPRDLPGYTRPGPVAPKLAIEGRDRPDGEADPLPDPMLPAGRARPAERPTIARVRQPVPAGGEEQGKDA